MSPCACEHEKKDEVAVQAHPKSRRRATVEQNPRVGQLAALEEEVNQGRGVQYTFQLREMLNGPVQRAAAGRVENSTGLNDSLKAGLEQLSGMDLSGVRVHYNSPRPAQLQALAYTQGQDIHVAPGQEQHLPHEGWHVVQQMQGRVRPTMQLQGTAINDSPGLEREADVMGARALKTGPLTGQALSSVQLKSARVVQRAMGMEVEMRRRITTPGGYAIEKGDTEILKHRFFTLVTDKTKGYSNLEFVMKHFDQLSGTEGDAIAELKERIAAMRGLADFLYAAEGKLGAIVAGIGPNPLVNPYVPETIDYTTGLVRTRFPAQEALISSGLDEDNKLYVHYTVGFEPRHWFKMVQDVQAVTRDDTALSRPKSHAGYAIAAVPDVLGAINVASLTAQEVEELRGHLALLYMQMSVFVERTLDLDVELRKKLQRARKRRGVSAAKIKDLNEQIDEANSRTDLNIIERDVLVDRLDKEKKRLTRKYQANERIVNNIKSNLSYVEGQQKNKIAALPRASLAQVFAALSPKVQGVLATNAETVIDKFAETLEGTLDLNLNEGFSLQSPTGESASLGDYLKAGLGSGTYISQQVLFGGMNEVGIDTSVVGKKLLPLEFRSVFDARVTWDELEAHAIKILKWSRDPQNNSLV